MRHMTEKQEDQIPKYGQIDKEYPGEYSIEHIDRYIREDPDCMKKTADELKLTIEQQSTSKKMLQTTKKSTKK